MGDLCTACMCAGRKLYYIGETGFYHLYTQILNEIPVYDYSQVCIRVCWECRAILHRFLKFKEQAKASYRELLEYINQGISITNNNLISKPANLQTYQLVDVLYPEVVNPIVKSEIDLSKLDFEIDVKTEPQSEQSVPEPFVDDFKIGVNDTVKLRKAKRKEKKPELANNENITDEHDYMGEPSSVLTPLTNQDYYEEYSELPVDQVVNDIDTNIDYNVVILTDDEVLKEREALKTDKYLNMPFKCDQCIVSFKSKKLLSHHDKNSHSKSLGPHSCQYCACRFKSTQLARCHIDTHTKRFACAACSTVSVSLAQHQCHVTKTHRKSSCEITCDVCGTVSSSAARHRSHTAKAHSETSKEVTCDICGTVSSSAAKHQSHMNKAHSEKPVCSECGKVFSSKKTYRYHLNAIHKGQNRFPCPHCGKVYQWKSNLWRHIRNHKARATGELYCELCDKKFSSVATYTQHKRISRRHVHESDFNFACDECGKKFVSKIKLRDHIDWEHLNKIKYRCQLCEKPFKSGTSLYVHLHNVHKKEERDNLCHVCGKSYQNTAKLKHHIVAMHSGETPYPCVRCDAVFSWYSSLYRHVKEVHEKVKVYKKPKRPRKENEMLPSLVSAEQMVLPAIHQAGPS